MVSLLRTCGAQVFVIISILAAWSICGTDVRAANSVVFHMLPTKVNDEIHQSIRCELDAERTIRQQNQLVDTSKQTMERMQDRSLKILAIQGGRPTRARLDYRVSVTNLTDEHKRAVKATQPIAGNVYLVQRDQQGLVITTEKGHPISDEEDKILRPQLQNFGQSNPLAEFLNGRSLSIGESIEVPKEVAAQLLGMTGNSAKTDKLGLKLVMTQDVEGERCAVFETLLKTSGQETAMSLIMKGELIIEVNTCRTRSIRLHGPVAISETRGPSIGRFVVSTNGTLDVAIRSSFGPTRLAARNKSRR